VVTGSKKLARYHVSHVGEMGNVCMSGNLKEEDHVIDLCVDGRIISNWIL
jgi:hypothetical protein